MSAVERDGPAVQVQEVLDHGAVTRAHFWIGLLCALILFIDGYNIAILGFLGPNIRDAWSLTEGQLGQVFSASLAGNLVGFMLLSPLSYQFGLKRMTLVAVVMFGVAEICAGLSGSVTHLILFRFIAGIGLAGGISNATALAGEYFPLRWRATAVTYTYIGFTAGQMASGGTTGILLQQGFDWRAPLVFGGSLALLSSIVLWRWLPESVEYLLNRADRPGDARAILNRLSPGSAPADRPLAAAGRSSDKGSVRQLFAGQRASITIMLWIAMSMNSLAIGSTASWLTTLLVNSGLSHGEAVGSATVATAAGIVAGLIVGPLMDRVGPFRVVIGLFLLGGIATFLLGMVMPMLIVGWILLLAFCQILCTSGITKGAGALVVHSYPTSLRSTAVGWMLGVSRLASIVGPLGIGYLLQQGMPPGGAFRMIAVPLVIGAIVLFAGNRMMAKQS